MRPVLWPSAIRTMKRQSKRAAARQKNATAVVDAFHGIAAEYAPNTSVFDEDPERVAVLKRIIAGLPLVDRTIMLLYCELQSTEELGRILHVSKRTAARKVAAIRADVVEKFNQLKQLK